MNHEKFQVQWNLDLGAKGLIKFVPYNEVSLYHYILMLLGWKKSFVISRTSLYRVSLYRGSTVAFTIKKQQKWRWQSVKKDLGN